MEPFNNPIRNFAITLGYHSRPKLIIAGAQKAGTTALFGMLEAMPGFTGSLVKEVHYFDHDNTYLRKDLAVYHKYFPLPRHIPKGNVVFEATPSYLYHPLVAERIHTYDPNMKIVILLREPVSRAFSAWTMYHHHFTDGPHRALHESRGFDVAVQKELHSGLEEDFYRNPVAYVRRGIYHFQIENFLKYFPREQLFIAESRRLRTEPEKLVHEICAFAGVPKSSVMPMVSNESQVDDKSAYTKTFAMLREFYAPHNERLFALLGESFDW